jgi:hypothetical protein
MEHRNQFTEEMLRRLYQRRGYQVMRLCSEVSPNRQKAIDMTFQAFGEAGRCLSASEQAPTIEYQDQVLLDCTRRIVAAAMPQPEQPQPHGVFVPEEMPAEPAPAEDFSSLEELSEEAPLFEQEPVQQPSEEYCSEESTSEKSDTTTESYTNLSTEEQEEAAELDLTDTSGSNFGWGLLVLVLVVVILGLLWAIWGVAQTIFPLPQLDLGYQWFNANIYPLF